MRKYIETRIKYDKTMDDGMAKTVTEAYLVDALSFAEAEARIIEEMTPYLSGDFSVSAVKKSNVEEIFYDKETSGEDKFYRVKVAFISIDEKTMKEKRQNFNYLVSSSSLKQALSVLLENMRNVVSDFSVVSIAECPILEIFNHEPKEETTEE